MDSSIESHIGSVSWNIRHILWLTSFKQCDVGEILVGFQGRWTSFQFTDFLRSSWYFSSIVISINFYYVECGDGRQPRISVDKFWIPRSKTRTCSTPGFYADMAEPCYFFFALIRAFAFFLLKAKTSYSSYGYSRPTSRLTLLNLRG